MKIEWAINDYKNKKNNQHKNEVIFSFLILYKKIINASEGSKSNPHCLLRPSKPTHDENINKLF